MCCAADGVADAAVQWMSQRYGAHDGVPVVGYAADMLPMMWSAWGQISSIEGWRGLLLTRGEGLLLTRGGGAWGRGACAGGMWGSCIAGRVPDSKRQQEIFLTDCTVYLEVSEMERYGRDLCWGWGVVLWEAEEICALFLCIVLCSLWGGPPSNFCWVVGCVGRTVCMRMRALWSRPAVWTKGATRQTARASDAWLRRSALRVMAGELTCFLWTNRIDHDWSLPWNFDVFWVQVDLALFVKKGHSTFTSGNSTGEFLCLSLSLSPCLFSGFLASQLFWNSSIVVSRVTWLDSWGKEQIMNGSICIVIHMIRLIMDKHACPVAV